MVYFEPWIGLISFGFMRMGEPSGGVRNCMTELICDILSLWRMHLMDESEIKRRLSRENPEFQQVQELHRQCENRLRELAERSYLTEEEELEERELKKKKLALKDKMYAMITRYQKAVR
jgi:uncharacterized protein YdcH (DUF465 family)